MRPLKYDKLSDRMKYDLDKFAHENRIEQLRVSHSRRYAGPPNNVTFPMREDEIMCMTNTNIVEGDVMNITIPLDHLMRLLSVDDKLRNYEMNHHDLYRQKQEVATRLNDMKYEEHLRKKHTPLQKVWEKYQFTKDMVTDPNKKT